MEDEGGPERASRFRMAKLITGIYGDVRKYFATERDGSGDVRQFRGHRQDCQPILDRVKQMSQAAPSRWSAQGEHKYIGSVPRTMIDDWLRRREKTWRDYVTDPDLKQAFELFMMAERPAFFMKAWRV